MRGVMGEVGEVLRRRLAEAEGIQYGERTDVSIWALCVRWPALSNASSFLERWGFRLGWGGMNDEGIDVGLISRALSVWDTTGLDWEGHWS